jgi:hypothetical protein
MSSQFDYITRRYNQTMRGIWNCSLAAIALGVMCLTVSAQDEAIGPPMTKVTVQVKTQSGRPVNQADVIVRFVKGHSVLKLGKAVRTQWEMRTNQEGTAVIPDIPQGQVRIQIIAKGYQTFGNTFDVTGAEKTVPIALNPPQQQYTSH